MATGMSWLFVLLFGGGLGPLSGNMPPGPEDPRLAIIAPQECLLYASWAGRAAPDPASKNGTERLLAEPQVVQMFEKIQQELMRAVAQGAGDRPARAAAIKELAILLDLLSRHPGAVMLSKLGRDQNAIDIEAALALSAGDDAAKAKASLEALEALVLQEGRVQVQEKQVGQVKLRSLRFGDRAPALAWGVADKYVLLLLGDATAQHVIARLVGPVDAAAPKWLTDLRKAAPVERPACVFYASPRLLQAIGAMGRNAANVPRVAAALGMNNVESIGVVAGLEGRGAVARCQVALDGEPAGLLAAFRGRGLTPADLDCIPADATIAIGARLNAASFWKEILNVVNGVDQHGRQRFDEELADTEKELGLSISNDLLAPLGDTWALYSAPSDGGFLITGATLVAKVKDKTKLADSNDKLIKAIQRAAGPRDPGERGVFVKEWTFQDQKIHSLNPVGERDFPFMPSWALAGDELVVSAYPQALKSYLLRKAQPEALKPLAAAPAAAHLFKDGRAPVFFMYCDTPTVLSNAYGMLKPVAPMVFGQIQRMGVELDMSILPTLGAIKPHVIPDTLAIYRNEAGLLLEHRGTMPSGIGPAGALMPMLSWAGVRQPAPPARAIDVAPPIIVEPVPRQ